MPRNSLSGLKKIQLYFIASKEAKGIYGDKLEFFNNSKNLPSNVSSKREFPISAYMERITKEYMFIRSNKVKKYKKKFINPLLFEIKKIYHAYEEEHKKMSDEISKLEKESEIEERKIENILSELGKKHKYKYDINTTGSTTPEMGVSNLTELKKQISALESELEREKEKGNSISTQVQESRKKTQKTPLNKATLVDLSAKFDEYRNLLFSEIEIFERKYDAELSYYWEVLCNKIDIVISSKTFEEICQLYNYKFIEKNDLFKDEADSIDEIKQKLEI